jgi:hypothetical protein
MLSDILRFEAGAGNNNWQTGQLSPTLKTDEWRPLAIQYGRHPILI